MFQLVKFQFTVLRKWAKAAEGSLCWGILRMVAVCTLKNMMSVQVEEFVTPKFTVCLAPLGKCGAPSLLAAEMLPLLRCLKRCYVRINKAIFFYRYFISFCYRATEDFVWTIQSFFSTDGSLRILSSVCERGFCLYWSFSLSWRATGLCPWEDPLQSIHVDSSSSCCYRYDQPFLVLLWGSNRTGRLTLFEWHLW